MKTAKIKRYRLGVSRTFPVTHPRKGKETDFETKILMGLQGYNNSKLHTIRANYPLWEKRMAEVQAGRAVIELFYWAGKPYHKDENGVGQVVFATLDKDSGCGLQHLSFPTIRLCEGKETPLSAVVYEPFKYKYSCDLNVLARNDGLSLEDFKAWFAKYNLLEPMAIIHFTKFRY